MVDTSTTPIGQINGAGATDALFLKVFAGEVITRFRERNVMMPLHRVKTITSGKSAQFPALGRATAAYHSPGENILDPTNSLLSQPNSAERVITIDDLLVSAVVIDNLDEARSHFEARSEYVAQIAEALAKEADTTLLQVGVLTARSGATVTGEFGGSALTDASMKTSATVLAAHIKEAAQTLDEKDVPQEGRYCALLPAQYHLLLDNRDLINRDFTTENGGLDSGVIHRISGIQLVMTNHLPTTNIAAVSGEKNTYNGDFTKTAGLVWQTGAFGTVKLKDLAMESEYKIEYQGTLFVGKYAMGHGILRPEAAVELATP